MIQPWGCCLSTWNCTYIYTYTQTQIYTPTHIYIYVYIYIAGRSQWDSYRAGVFRRGAARTCIYTHTCIHTHTHVYIHTHIVYIHTHTCTFVYIYFACKSLSLPLSLSLSLSFCKSTDLATFKHINIQIFIRIYIGYFSTVQGLLDCFEVDLGFTQLSFIQIVDLAVDL